MRLWSKIKTTLLTLGVSLILITTPSFAFDKEVSEENKAKIESVLAKPDAYYSFVTVQAFGTADALYQDTATGTWVRSEAFWDQMGSGTVVAPGWVLTAAHVVEPDMVNVSAGSVASFTTPPIKINSTTILLRDYRNSSPHVAWVNYIDRERDVALLRYVPQGVLEPIPYALETDGMMLEDGDVVAIVVHERNEDGSLDYRVKMRWGTVLKAGPMGMSDEVTAWLSPYDFTMDCVLIGGDSGSLVYVFKEGQPYFVGIARAASFDGFVFMSYAAWIGEIIARILSIG